LGSRNHRGPYLGVDFSLPLLRDAASTPEVFSARFLELDLTTLTPQSEQVAALRGQAGHWSLITAFAVLHHIPSDELRCNILQAVHSLLAPEGLFIHSHWQFLNSEKLKARIQPWDAVAGLGESDAGDFILDWRSGGTGLRYVHHFTEAELRELADATGFTVRETFYSDGASGNLGLYQVWGIQ
jgi:2-polyprenyl-3-methyl-5-hydroxy-6-metoxy-1,4-benzoquinol methylase